jgi:hypothetical protein
MSYECKQMLKGIVETPWREMDGFAEEVLSRFPTGPKSDRSAHAMASALVEAAVVLLRHLEQQERDAKAAKADGAAA